MVTELDEERQRLWELVKANLEKVHKRYKDFANKSQQEVKFQKRDKIEHQELLITRRFKS